jgi:predicted Zn-dependent protease
VKAVEYFREQVAANPKSLTHRVWLATMLACSGRADEGRADVEAAAQAWSENLNRLNSQLLAGYYAAAGNAAQAVSYLRRVVNRGAWNGMLSVYALKLDPAYDRIRATPEFQDLLANPPPLPAPLDEGSALGPGR